MAELNRIDWSGIEKNGSTEPSKAKGRIDWSSLGGDKAQTIEKEKSFIGSAKETVSEYIDDPISFNAKKVIDVALKGKEVVGDAKGIAKEAAGGLVRAGAGVMKLAALGAETVYDAGRIVGRLRS
jgi:hypothetical protein